MGKIGVVGLSRSAVVTNLDFRVHERLENYTAMWYHRCGALPLWNHGAQELCEINKGNLCLVMKCRYWKGNVFWPGPTVIWGWSSSLVFLRFWNFLGRSIPKMGTSDPEIGSWGRQRANGVPERTVHRSPVLVSAGINRIHPDRVTTVSAATWELCLWRTHSLGGAHVSPYIRVRPCLTQSYR